MTRTLLAATAALTLMTGIASAQMSQTTTTTTETSAVPVVPVAPMVMPVVPTSVENSKQRTVDSFGNVTEHSNSVSQGTAVSPFGDVTTTRRTTETSSSVR
jgi:hypothetical protein